VGGGVGVLYLGVKGGFGGVWGLVLAKGEPACLCVAQATLAWLFTGAIPTPGLKRSVGLSLPGSWDYRRAPPRPALPARSAANTSFLQR
uniref:Uncharacterized protein n=1 Tax=Catharus ustulatus TaxID=91951 RepID=A0A8C3VAX9_CATUS